MLIYSALDFIHKKLESHLKKGKQVNEPMIVLGSPWSHNDNNKNTSFLNSISLINVEEEKVFKSQVPRPVQRENGKYSLQEPDIKLNLYILISAYNKNYEDGLKIISEVVSFFQSNVVFEKESAKLPDGVEKIIAELYTVNFEQQNQIWASLSTGYLPSVIYKLRMFVVESEPGTEEYQPITEINVEY